MPTPSNAAAICGVALICTIAANAAQACTGARDVQAFLRQAVTATTQSGSLSGRDLDRLGDLARAVEREDLNSFLARAGQRGEQRRFGRILDGLDPSVTSRRDAAIRASSRLYQSDLLYASKVIDAACAKATTRTANQTGSSSEPGGQRAQGRENYIISRWSNNAITKVSAVYVIMLAAIAGLMGLKIVTEYSFALANGRRRCKIETDLEIDGILVTGHSVILGKRGLRLEPETRMQLIKVAHLRNGTSGFLKINGKIRPCTLLHTDKSTIGVLFVNRLNRPQLNKMLEASRVPPSLIRDIKG